MQQDPDAEPAEIHESEEGCETEQNAYSPTMRGRFFESTDETRLLSALASPLPIELEIGSGKGLFLTRAAAENPNHQFIGLELATKYARDSQSLLEKRGITNGCFIACDAVAVLDQDVATESMTAIHVYFPDPWWKSRHKKRRVLSEQTLINIERCLKPGCDLHFWTDVLDYYENTLELVDQITKLKGPFFVSEPKSENDMDYRTHFERRTRLNGLPVYRSRFTKVVATPE